MTHDCYRARGWVGGRRVGASKGSQKSSRSEEGQQACACCLPLSSSQHGQDAAAYHYMLPAADNRMYSIVGRCAAYMAPWH